MTSGPRNRKAYEHGLAVRAAVRDILASRTQLEPVLTARQINQMLPPALRRCDSVIRWHRLALQTEYLLQSLDRPAPC
jgi:hypothetical protein